MAAILYFPSGKHGGAPLALLEEVFTHYLLELLFIEYKCRRMAIGEHSRVLETRF